MNQNAAQNKNGTLWNGQLAWHCGMRTLFCSI